MADDRKSVGEPTGSPVSGSQVDELRDLAEEARIPVDQARELIEKHGTDRDTLMAEAAKLGDPREGLDLIHPSETMD